MLLSETSSPLPHPRQVSASSYPILLCNNPLQIYLYHLHMTTNISPDGSTTISQPADHSQRRTLNGDSASPSLSDLSYRATNYQHSASDYMDALRTTMATIASVIDFYDPSGVLNSQWNLSVPSEDVDESQTDATSAQEHTSSLFSSSEAPTSPPGLG